MSESNEQFEGRKKDHLQIALDEKSQATASGGLDFLDLIHEALPEIDFAQVNIRQSLWAQSLMSPLFISSMTAGHAEALPLNRLLAKAAQTRGWAMGVGSQRKELSDPQAAAEWLEVRKTAPAAVLIGNIGIAQLIKTPVAQIQRLVDNLQAQALFVHLNPLQEVLQKEGTTNFAGGLSAIQNLCKALSVPVIVKEVGCGLSENTLRKLMSTGIYAVDVAGLGGTHWGRIEGLRAKPDELQFLAAQTFQNWGIPTVQSLRIASRLKTDYKLWASGGVRSGLDAAKLIALGAQMVGVAKPLLQAAVQGEQALYKAMERLEFELKIAMFCTGCENLQDLQTRKVYEWRKSGENL